MKRKFPLFLIDKSQSTSYPFDFITCNDSECGFTARVVPFYEDIAFEMFVKHCNAKEGYRNLETYKFKAGGGVVIVIEQFTYDVDLTLKVIENRVQALLKKALKKYIHAAIDSTPTKLDLDSQIKQQKLTLERAIQNYDALVERCQGDKRLADHQIALVNATIESLERLKSKE